MFIVLVIQNKIRGKNYINTYFKGYLGQTLIFCWLKKVESFFNVPGFWNQSGSVSYNLCIVAWRSLFVQICAKIHKSNLLIGVLVKTNTVSGPGAIKPRRAHFWSQSPFIHFKWDWDQKWPRLSFMSLGP